MSQMRPGRIVSIRVNPRDCMSVVDVIEKIGMHVNGMSYSQAVSVALSSALEGLRQAGLIPTRDGFEYSKVMTKFPIIMKGQRGRALDITKTFTLAGDSAQVRPVKGNPERMRKQRRYEELCFKLEGDPENFSPAEHEEVARLTAELFPIEDETTT